MSIQRAVSLPIKSWSASLCGLLEWLKSPRAQRALMIGASVFLAGGTVVAASALDLAATEIELKPLFVLMLVMVPATLAANALETELAAVMVASRFGWNKAMRIGVLSTAANALPLPGGPIVRIAALKAAGADLRAAGIVTLAIALLWLGLSLGYAGVWLIGRHMLIAAGFMSAGVVLVVYSGVVMRRFAKGFGVVVAAALLKSFHIVLGIMRMALALATIGVAADLSQVSVFAVSSVAGAAVSVVPAGLGVTESVATLLAGLVTLSPAAVFLATGINRLAGFVVLFPVTLLLGLSPINDRRQV